MMPSQYTSEHSLEDAAECARLLGIRYDTVPVTPAVAAFADTHSRRSSPKRPAGITEENIQSRSPAG